MGQNITVNNNHIIGAGDVGIDFEGCFDSSADSNTVADGHNGALATFVVTKNITFSNNTVTTSNSGWPLYRSYNSSLDPTYGTGNLAGMGAAMRANTFSCSSGIGSIDDHNGPCALSITGNHLTNVQIALTSGLDSHGVPTGFNGAGPSITSNTLLFSTDVSYAYAGIDSYYYFGNATVSQNSVTYSGATNANKTGIHVRTLPNTSSSINVIGNTVRGFYGGDISVYCQPNGSNTTTVNTNHVQGRNIKVGSTSATAIYAAGNVDLNGAGVGITTLP